jgi:hypothetical protein
MKDTTKKPCIFCGSSKWGYIDSKGIKVCWNCSHKWAERTKRMALFDLMEVPVKTDRQNEFRKEVAETEAEIKNVIEIVRDKFLLFIVDPKNSDRDKIMDAGFKTFLSEKGLEIYQSKNSDGAQDRGGENLQHLTAKGLPPEEPAASV